MRRFLPAVAALSVGVALIATGCGGTSNTSSSGGSIPGSASLVPAGAPLYIYANTDFGGDQWTQLNSLLAKFPDRAQLTGSFQKQLTAAGVSWDDVKAALGPDTAASALSFGTAAKAFLLTQPKDSAKLDALIKQLDKSGSSPTKTTAQSTIDGWTVVADSQATLDAVTTADKGPSLADSAAFKTAFDALPSDALFKVYVDGPTVADAVAKQGGTTGTAGKTLRAVKSLAASLATSSDGIGLQVVTQGNPGVEPFKPSLTSEVPSGALVYLSFHNLGPQVTKLLAKPSAKQFSSALTLLGVTPAELAKILSGEGALYVRAGSPLPEVTLLLTETDANAAVATVDKLTSKAAASLGTTVQKVTLGSVQARRMTVRNVPIYYAAVDGKLVISDSEAGITGLTGGGQKLADDPVFKQAMSAADVPDETTGLLYVNMKDTVPVLDSFATIAGQPLSTKATSNLEHVRSFVVYGTASGETSTFKAFAEIQ